MQPADSRFASAFDGKTIAFAGMSFPTTEAELVRRVDRFLDDAIFRRDPEVLRHIGALLDSGYTNTPARVQVPYVDDACLVDAIRWVADQYFDMIDKAGLRARCLNNPPDTEVHDTLARAERTLGIPLDATPVIKALPSAAPGFSVEVTLDIHGVGFSKVASRLKHHIQIVAQRHCAGAPSRGLSRQQIVQQFMADMLVQAADTPATTSTQDDRAHRAAPVMGATLPMPDIYANKFQWASAWVQERPALLGAPEIERLGRLKAALGIFRALDVKQDIAIY